MEGAAREFLLSDRKLTCRNVWALEAVLKSYPSSGEFVLAAVNIVLLCELAEQQPKLTAGTFLTFAQFLYVTVQTISSQIEWNDWVPRRRRNVVPLSRWTVQVVLFVAVSLSEFPGVLQANSAQ